MESRHPDATVDAVLRFWFDELEPRQRFMRDDAVDAIIATRFGTLLERLAPGLPPEWPRDARAILAAVVVLDQFPRNIHRDDPRAFASDAAALALASRAIESGLDAVLDETERCFLYMPFQHSEDRAVQSRSIELFEALGNAQTTDYAVRHQVIIERFGRFPHRNAALGRESTAEEIAFLEQPGSSF